MLKEILRMGNCLYSYEKLEGILKELKEEGFEYSCELVCCSKRGGYLGIRNTRDHHVDYVSMKFVKEDKPNVNYMVTVYSEHGTNFLSVAKNKKKWSRHEKYSLDYEDEIPDEGLEGEVLETYSLNMEEPYFSEVLWQGISDKDYSTEAAELEELEIHNDFSDFASHELNSWKYKIVMQNNDIYNALFALQDINFSELIKDLRETGYTLISVGMRDIRRITDSMSACGFKNNESFLYVVVYFSKLEERFMVRMISSDVEKRCVIAENREIWMYNVDKDSDLSGMSTFVSGFDFEDFREGGILN